MVYAPLIALVWYCRGHSCKHRCRCPFTASDLLLLPLLCSVPRTVRYCRAQYLATV